MKRTLRRVLRLVVAIPLLVLLVLFALTPANRAAVPLGLWPTDIVWVAPLSIIVLSAAALFFFLGALMVWLTSLGQRWRARKRFFFEKKNQKTFTRKEPVQLELRQR